MNYSRWLLTLQDGPNVFANPVDISILYHLYEETSFHTFFWNWHFQVWARLRRVGWERPRAARQHMTVKVKSPKPGWSLYHEFENYLRFDILIHNWASKLICSISYDANLHLMVRMPRKHLYKRWNNSRRSRPPSAADFFGCFEVLNTDVSWASKLKNVD